MPFALFSTLPFPFSISILSQLPLSCLMFEIFEMQRSGAWDFLVLSDAEDRDMKPEITKMGQNSHLLFIVVL